MAATCEAPFTGLFDQAVQTFGDALKAGVKAQEQLLGFWTDAVAKATPPASDYQKRTKAFFTEVVPTAQKNVDEYLKVLETNYRRSVDVLKRACEAGNVNSPTEFQAKAQGLWEASVQVVKENTEALAQANLKVLEQCAEFLRQNGTPVTVPGVVVPGPKAGK